MNFLNQPSANFRFYRPSRDDPQIFKDIWLGRLAIHAGIQLWINALAKPERLQKHENPSRVNSKFLKPLKLIWVVQTAAEEYLAWLEVQISR
jgi:hypothetical protein